MLDIKFIRQNPEKVKEGVAKKQAKVDIDRLLELDVKKRELEKRIEDLTAEQNKISKGLKESPTKAEIVIKDITTQPRAEVIEVARNLKEEIKKLEPELESIEKEFKLLMLQVPNIPDDSVPEGKSDADNQEIRKWGETPRFDFPIKNHIQLANDLNLIDFDRGAKVAGFRGYFLKNEAVLLSMALWSYAMESLMKKGFVPFVAPSLVKEFNFMGTGWLPQAKDEVYSVGEELYLAGTAEVPMMGLHSNEILEELELPKKYIAISPCFRSEAGSYGKDVKGIYRLHEFMKVEQVILCKNDHEESVKWHEEITKNSEELVQGLKLPYRVVVNCTGDLGLGQIKKYDIEVWIPSQNKYGETHSSSYFHDFQTRRLNIRYRDKSGGIKFVHSLNNTAIATPRILIQILENYQQKDGSVLVPKALQKYTGFKNIITD